ncbi:heme A synthase [Rhodococcus kroppenstedtii]|uniref:Heme A synthase n=1 Tax=Rhodococcoides kroppenstedtii TaxID=293050 RepID=A0ABS7NN16_9NOCA|nr:MULTISPECIES: heme A synthase [Rhodococcus]AMY19037.1 Heme A synthase [Rhodococcus sp. PBTS 1]MBY6311807.1 heme A synthase [Rhodococcus kroppenstedtii]MBY6319391.1 heme A synthase [Rhodococcus kroppenstedtii]MBY6398074.1 heme A synthase [Rhodococcus kroppenstedtii]MDV7197666.1 heme A synthase [Rhodococcus kroppenstedtii]
MRRAYFSLVDRLPLPSVRAQRIIAFLVILTQGGISVTGAVVRVTGSGLGCPTWPQCFPGSFTPVGVSEVPVLHQAVEFGNRMLTFLVVLTAAAIVLAVTRARRRREIVAYAWLMPAGTVLQAGVGGITVLTGLLWWTVAVHLIISMLMVWLATLLFHKIGEQDDAVSVATVPAPLRWLTALSATVLAGVLVAGTMVTGAGPHAGDADVARLEVEIVTLVHLHAELLVGYLALLVGLTFGVYAVGRAGVTPLKRRLHVLLALVISQSVVGIVQYFTDVPAALVAVHVAGAALCTAATAAVWAACREREEAPGAEAQSPLRAFGNRV